MFSEELRILDNNTVKYMVDQLEEEIKEKDAALAIKDAALASKDAALASRDEIIAKLQAELEQYKQQA